MMTVVERQRLPGEVSKLHCPAHRRLMTPLNPPKQFKMGTQSQACTYTLSAECTLKACTARLCAPTACSARSWIAV